MTTVATKTKIEPNWDTKKKAQVTARIVASQCLTAMSVLSKAPAELKEEFENTIRKNRIEGLKKMGANTAIELATAMAEVDANLYGSNIEVSGDEKQAELQYNECGMWNAMKEIGQLTPEQQAQMGEGFQACMSKTLSELGFKGAFKLNNDVMTITITK